MKIETVGGAIVVRAETPIEASFLTLWKAELIRKLELEGNDAGILDDLIGIDPYFEEQD